MPEDRAQSAHVKSVLRQIHRQFIDAVKQGRGDKLTKNADLFSGLFWSGEQARTLGLVDHFGSLDQVARDIIGAQKIIDYTTHETWLDRLSEPIGALINTLLMKNNFVLR